MKHDFEIFPALKCIIFPSPVPVHLFNTCETLVLSSGNKSRQIWYQNGYSDNIFYLSVLFCCWCFFVYVKCVYCMFSAMSVLLPFPMIWVICLVIETFYIYVYFFYFIFLYSYLLHNVVYNTVVCINTIIYFSMKIISNVSWLQQRWERKKKALAFWSMF